MQPTDEELAARAKAGDYSATSELWDRYLGKMVRYACALLRGEYNSDAEDLGTEGLQRAFQRIHRFRAGEKFKPWAYRVVHNWIIAKARRRRIPTISVSNDGAPLDALATRETSASQPETPVLNLELARILQEALGSLNDIHYAAVILVWVEGLSVADAADTLGVPKGTVWSRVHTVRRALTQYRTQGGTHLRDYYEHK